MNYVLVDGNLTLDINNIDQVGIHALPNNLLYDVHIYEVVEKARNSTFSYASAPTYYIKTEYDINSHISYQPSSTIDGADDQYGMSVITRNLAQQTADNYVTEYNFPSTSSQVEISVGRLDIQNPQETEIGAFNVIMKLSVDPQTRMSASIAITGNAVSADVYENHNKTQIAYWNLKDEYGVIIPEPSITPLHADNLTTPINNSQLTSHYKTELDNITAMYDNNILLSDWSITIDEITPTADSMLSKYARHMGRAGNPNPFEDGEMIIATTPLPLNIHLKDYTGESVSLISGSVVYGVFVQKTPTVVP
jgi:hypothetical protein